MRHKPYPCDCAECDPYHISEIVRADLIIANHGLDAEDATELEDFCKDLEANVSEFTYRLWLNEA